MASVVTVQLPHALELAAIARKNGLDAVAAVRLSKTWDPCTATVLDFLRDPEREDAHRATVARALARFCADPYLIGWPRPPLDERHPDIHTAVFIRPTREPLPAKYGRKPGAVYVSENVLEILTPTLVSMFDGARKQVADGGRGASEVLMQNPFQADMYKL